MPMGCNDVQCGNLHCMRLAGTQRRIMISITELCPDKMEDAATSVKHKGSRGQTRAGR